MARALRSDVFDPDTVGVYHCYNRIVRRSFLCGFDPISGNDYSHRRGWLYRRLRYFAKHFAIDVLGYAILSNHFHVVLRNRPDKVKAMSDREVVTAWLMICPKSGKQPDGTILAPTENEIRVELNAPGEVEKLRGRLSSPSWLMRQLCQYMGIRCNAEDEMRGHFWESRFGMKRLLDEAAVLACLAYVDLNPIRAGLAGDLESYEHVSIGERMRALGGGSIDPLSWLASVELASAADGESAAVVNRMTRQELAESLEAQSQQLLGTLPVQMGEYVRLLRWLAVHQRPELRERFALSSGSDSSGASVLEALGLKPSLFIDAVFHYGHRFFSAVGCTAELEREARRRGRGRLNGPGRRALDRRTARSSSAGSQRGG